MARFQTILATVLLWFITHLQINILGMILRDWLPKMSAEEQADIRTSLLHLVHFAQGTFALLAVGLALICWFCWKRTVEKFMSWCVVLQCLLLTSGALVYLKLTYPRFNQWERGYRAFIEEQIRKEDGAIRKK